LIARHIDEEKGRALRELLSGPAWDVAPVLLGCVLRCRRDGASVAVLITEVEAYDGETDPASHAYRRVTPRNTVMFGPAGHLYVYRSYGIHWCANIVTGVEGKASAVLVRAGRLVEGSERARLRRGERVRELDLTRGPGRLCQALGLEGGDNGGDLLSGGEVSLGEGNPVPRSAISSGPRVGVSAGHVTPWRFWIAGDPSVSAYKLSPRAPKDD
jgi:DNA-3-methyladenine glycosylase